MALSEAHSRQLSMTGFTWNTDLSSLQMFALQWRCQANKTKVDGILDQGRTMSR
jgi:hypothetical protein